jgi:Ca2+-binding EF-hand superfamily protein
MELGSLELEAAGAIMGTLMQTNMTEPRRAFEAWDSNGDGFLDSEEFHALLRELDGDVSRAECLLVFQAADTEGDGYIGFKEFEAWWTN